MKRPDIGCSSADRGNERILHPAVGSLEFFFSYPQFRSCEHCAVKLLRITEQRSVAFFFNISHDLFYRFILLWRSILNFPLQLEFLARLYLHRRFPLLHL
ncbi:hypothetical protein D3C75_1200080 [compost metagenome]